MPKTGHRVARLLLSLADVITIVAPVFADWNDSHIFNERWPAHARFHGVVGLSLTALLSGFSLVRLWTTAPAGSQAADLAAIVPVAYWGSFFPAVVVRGTGVDDEPHRVARIMGIPANLFYAALAIAGWTLERRSR